MTVVVTFVMVFIVIVLVDDVVAVVIPKRHVMPMGITAVKVVTNGMGVPIRVDSFPVMKTRRANGIKWQPDVPGSQIVILITDDADEFNTIPDVSIGNC